MSPRFPKRPEEAFRHPTEPAKPNEDWRRWATEPESPTDRLVYIRDKMEKVALEFANREISRAQFNAIYAHYNEQRTIIERMMSRDPNNPGWKQAARSGKTQFLRQHFEGHPVNYVIYLHHMPRPLMGGGTRPNMQKIAGLLRALWSLEKQRIGVARVTLNEQMWLIMAAGVFSVTFVTYSLEPSGAQANQVRDLHSDFERANRIFLERGTISKAQMVFPQRALLENKSDI